MIPSKHFVGKCHWGLSSISHSLNRAREQYANSFLLAKGTMAFFFFFLNGPSLASFSFIIGLFQTNINTILQQINVEKCPSSIRHWDSNPRPSESKSPPITTRPGLLPWHQHSYFDPHQWNTLLSAHWKINFRNGAYVLAKTKGTLLPSWTLTLLLFKQTVNLQIS